mmetsp:Transcript_24238/g.35916  ORF Transcript_24238/g.35916 Transcript_24238/m.35916 type:complete len:620 (+) Transcript_24238:134-1993(+)
MRNHVKFTIPVGCCSKIAIIRIVFFLLLLENVALISATEEISLRKNTLVYGKTLARGVLLTRSPISFAIYSLMTKAAQCASTTVSSRFIEVIHDNNSKIENEANVAGENVYRAFRFWQKVGPIVAHYKFTQFWLNARQASPELRSQTWNKLHHLHAPTSLDVILELRGLYVKIGQVMSSRADFVPRPYVDAFGRLQDEVPAWSSDRIKRIVKDSLKTRQGLEMDQVFESFGEVLGSASIGQVHRAVVKPQFAIGGKTQVAVKVMHPDAEQRFAHDFSVFRWLCRVALPGWEPILQELQRQMMTEFCYLNEGDNLASVRTNMANSPYAKRLIVPEPAMALCSKNLLVMELLEGTKLAVAMEDRLAEILGGQKDLAQKVLKAKQQAVFEGEIVNAKNGNEKYSLFHELSKIIEESNNGKHISIVGKAIKTLQLMSLAKDIRKKLDLVVDVTGYQIMNDGCFNGDPHPGNILLLKSGKLGLIDYGQTRYLGKDSRLSLARIIAALGKNEKNPAEIADAMRAFGFQSQNNNDEIVAKQAALYFDSDSEGKAMGLATPQTYLQHLNSIDFMEVVPDPAVFVARTSFLFRGMGALLQQDVHTAKYWRKHAVKALKKEEASSSEKQ